MANGRRRRLRWTTVASAAGGLLLAVAGAAAWLALGSLPDYDGTWQVPGLERTVEIERDEWAVPHIRARSARDAYLALGFVHAQDRLWQLELHRRVATGRLAEVVGEAALPIDRLMRLLGLGRLAEAGVATLTEDARPLAEAYAAGINAFVAGSRRPLPPEFQIFGQRPEPWTVADTLAFAKLMALDLSGNWREELRNARLARRLSPDRLEDLRPPDDGPSTIAGLDSVPADLDPDRLAAALPLPWLGAGASNVFALAGSRTATGAPLLASDPHLGLRAPGIWYLAALEAPDLAAAGGTLPGLPFVTIGRNRDVAWGFTATHADTQDLFVERLDPAERGRYLAPEGALPFVSREETIAVRGREPERLTVRATRHGPVISDIMTAMPESVAAGHVLALAWPALLPDDRTMAAGFALAGARDWPGFRRALADFGSPVQNVAFAGRDGTIAFATVGRIPVRRAGDGRVPVPGWDGAHDWTGFVPVPELPSTVAPAGGFVVNANNRVVPESYPYLVAAEWPTTYRAERLTELLAERTAVGLDEAASVQLDLRSGIAERLLPHLPDPPTDDRPAVEVVAALRGWDRLMRPDRPEPLIFAAWYEALAARIVADELGTLFDGPYGVRSDVLAELLRERPVWCDDVTTSAAEGCAEQAAGALKAALARLSARYGPDWRAWRWDVAHPAVMAHRPLGEVPVLGRAFDLRVPVGGDGSTVAVAPAGPEDARSPFPVVHAAGLRMLVDLSDREPARFVAATGQSGHPLSRHYDDLTRLWQQGRYVTMPSFGQGPARAARHRLTLVPADRVSPGT